MKGRIMYAVLYVAAIANIAGVVMSVGRYHEALRIERKYESKVQRLEAMEATIGHQRQHIHLLESVMNHGVDRT